MVQKSLIIGLAFSSVLGLWTIAALEAPTYLLPSPIEVLRSLSEAFENGKLVKDIWATTYTSIIGLVVAALIAAFLAFIFILLPTAEAIFYPLIVALRSVPAVAAAPLLIIWTGTGTPAKILLAAIVSFFPILVFVLDEFKRVPQNYTDQFIIWDASSLDTIKHLRVPMALGAFFASLKVAVTYALIGSFIAELMGSQNGLGHMIFSAYYQFDTPLVLGGVICFAVLGLAMFGLTLLIERITLSKYPLS